MSHQRDMADQDVEEVAEELWTLGEEGQHGLDDLKRTTRVDDLDRALDRMTERGLATVSRERVLLTAKGRDLAEQQVRRHRLCEVLFSTVLEIEDDSEANRAACVMEHVLGSSVTDSVCAFLGHPKSCPHGKPIPPGRCCQSVSSVIEPLVQPLDQLALGQSGRIVHIVPKEASRLAKLSSVGVAPGTTVRLRQKRPAVVLDIGETTLAVEPEIAGEIYVKRVD